MNRNTILNMSLTIVSTISLSACGGDSNSSKQNNALIGQQSFKVTYDANLENLIAKDPGRTSLRYFYQSHENPPVVQPPSANFPLEAVTHFANWAKASGPGTVLPVSGNNVTIAGLPTNLGPLE